MIKLPPYGFFINKMKTVVFITITTLALKSWKKKMGITRIF